MNNIQNLSNELADVSPATQGDEPTGVIQSRRSRAGGKGGRAAAERGEEPQNAQPVTIAPWVHDYRVHSTRKHGRRSLTVQPALAAHSELLLPS